MTRALRALALLLATGAPAPLGAQEGAAFFKDKTIRIIVGSAAGAGYDINARVLARHYGNHIPGKPTIIVQNQPGAGSLTMTNSVYNSAPRDGTVIGAAINGMPTAPLLSPEAVRFDVTKIIWLGSTNRDTQISYVWKTSPVQSLADLAEKELIVGATAPGTTQVDYPLVASHVLGLKYKVVSGYPGTSDIHTAMERGEVHGLGANAWMSLKALNSNWVREGNVKVLVQFALRRHPDLPEVPTVFELAKTDEQRQALRLMVARLEYGRPFFLPPEVPADRVGVLRRAFEDTVKDPSFLADARKAQLDIDPMTGQEIANLVAEVTKTPSVVIARVQAALKLEPATKK